MLIIRRFYRRVNILREFQFLVSERETCSKSRDDQAIEETDVDTSTNSKGELNLKYKRSKDRAEEKSG